MPKSNLKTTPHHKTSISRKLPKPLLIFFQRTPCDTLTSLELRPPHELPHLKSTTTLHRTSLSIAWRHNHFLKRARLKMSKFWIPNPLRNQRANHGPTYQMQFELFADTTPKEIQLKLFNAIGNTPKGEEKEKRTK
jgi:hypothetical protein